MLRLFRRRAEPKQAVIDIAGKPVSVAFRRNKQARRLIIRLSRRRDGVIVTMPPRSSAAEALDFARRSQAWIAARLAAEQETVAFASGAAIPVRDVKLIVTPENIRRGTVRIDTGRLLVPGDAAHLPRRVTDWLKAEAKRDLLRASEHYAAAMEVKFRRLTVRDQASRWGSCSADGALSYSWRLILAPSFVLDYVAAHEVAHLRHMDHSPRFWRLVLMSCDRAAEARTWLRRNGASIHRYG